MSLFPTTAEQVVKLAAIVTKMNEAGLDAPFLARAMRLASEDQGAFHLMELWTDPSASPTDRDDVIADIQDALDDQDEPSAAVKKPYIAFDRLPDVSTRIGEEKKRLRALIDKHGGVSAVASKSGIPQPSLSRLLNSASMPRRTTLYKIANALGLSEEDIVFEWIR